MRYILLLFIFLSVHALCAGKTPVNAAEKDTTAFVLLRLDEGIAQYKKGNFDEALKLLNEAVSAASKSRDNASLIKALNNIGNVYADQGKNPLSLKYYQQALKIAESVADHRNIAHIQKNIGALYTSWKQFETALGFYDKALEQAIMTDDSSLVADCYNNKGTVYEQQEKYEAALAVYKKALHYYESAGQQDGIAMSLSNIAIVYKLQKDYASSILYNEKSLAIAEKLGDKWMTSAILNNIGNLYGQTGNYKAAMDYCSRSLAIAEEIKAPEIIIMAYESMADASAKKGDYKNAFAYQKKFAGEKDRFINTESTQQLSELQVKYDTEKKEHENQQLQLENKLKTAERNKAEFDKQLILYSSIVIFFAAALIFFLLNKNKRFKEKAAEQQAINKAIFDSEQKERIRIARDLHDSIGQMLSAMKMQLSTLQHRMPRQPETDSALKLVDKTIEEVRTISHNLIPEALNFGLISALNELTDAMNVSGKSRIIFSVTGDLAGQQLSKQLELSVYRIVQEVITNMIRHSEASEIQIALAADEKRLSVSLSDNGRGFDLEKIADSKGIGWKNVAARVSLLNGMLHLFSEKNKGSRIEIIIPT